MRLNLQRHTTYISCNQRRCNPFTWCYFLFSTTFSNFILYNKLITVHVSTFVKTCNWNVAYRYSLQYTKVTFQCMLDKKHLGKLLLLEKLVIFNTIQLSNFYIMAILEQQLSVSINHCKISAKRFSQIIVHFKIKTDLYCKDCLLFDMSNPANNCFVESLGTVNSLDLR